MDLAVKLIGGLAATRGRRPWYLLGSGSTGQKRQGLSISLQVSLAAMRSKGELGSLSFPRAGARGDAPHRSRRRVRCIIGSPGTEVFPALVVGDLEGDALGCVEIQLLFVAAFPLPSLSGSMPRSSARSISSLRKIAEA